MRVLPKLGVALLAAIVALCVAEGLARIIGLPPHYGQIVPLDGVPTRTVGGVVLWSDKRPRHDERDLARVAGDRDAFKILGLGDSIMYGVHLPKEATYLEQTRRLLEDGSKRRVEVLNMAVPGYNTLQENAVYAELGERVRPDVVLVHYWGNDSRQYRVVGGHVVDFGDVSADGRFVVRALPLPPAVSDFLLIHSRLYDLLTYVVVDYRRRRAPVDWSTVSKPLSEIHERARQGGARLLILASPELGGATPKATADLPALEQFASERGIEVVDLAAWLEGVESKRIALDGCHFNAEGHRIIAERLAEHLLDGDSKR